MATDPRPGHTLPEHARFILDNGDEQQLVVVARLGLSKFRDIAYLQTKEGWSWKQLQQLGREIEAVPDMIDGLAACHASITTLLGSGEVEMPPLVRVTLEHCLSHVLHALDHVYADDTRQEDPVS